MISVLVPYAGDCPHRARAWEQVRSQFDGFEVVEGHADPAAWCKAVAVADALTRASGDLLVIHDADVWSESLRDAIAAVESGEYRWGSPHRRVRRLTESGEVEETHNAHLGGGIVVIGRETYTEVPLDPRYIGWGQEDDSWAIALHTLAGPPYIGTDTLTHFWHPPQARKSRSIGSDASKFLLRRYKDARHKPRAMRALLDEVTDAERVQARP